MKKPSGTSRPRRPAIIRVGTSGWSYAHWRRVFYPEDLPSAKWLRYYCRYFDTVEINNTFYNLPKDNALEKWRREAPSGFVFAVKANRYITHMKKLKDVDDSVSVFLSRLNTLKRHLGPILFQLPPNLNVDLNRLRAFLATLPRRRRYVVEFRNTAWLDDGIIDVLRKRRVAFCIHDLLDGDCPRHVTAPFAYYRFHGHNVKYGGSYPKKVLRAYAEEMVSILESGKDVYAYFNNDAFGYALKDAVTLRKMVSKLLTG
jgi:uncharacterized protein YecE (DUF72 family)